MSHTILRPFIVKVSVVGYFPLYIYIYIYIYILMYILCIPYISALYIIIIQPTPPM